MFSRQSDRNVRSSMILNNRYAMLDIQSASTIHQSALIEQPVGFGARFILRAVLLNAKATICSNRVETNPGNMYSCNSDNRWSMTDSETERVPRNVMACSIRTRLVSISQWNTNMGAGTWQRSHHFIDPLVISVTAEDPFYNATSSTANARP